MVRFLWPAVLAAAAFGGEPLYELSGQLLPPGWASVSLFGTRSPFTAAAVSAAAGRFSFKKLRADDYTVSGFPHPRFEGYRRRVRRPRMPPALAFSQAGQDLAQHAVQTAGGLPFAHARPPGHSFCDLQLPHSDINLPGELAGNASALACRTPKWRFLSTFSPVSEFGFLVTAR
jgi:hypothetical protein